MNRKSLNNKKNLASQVQMVGGRMTKQRQAVLDILKMAKGEHLTPEEVCNRLKNSSKNVSLATVYRTLILLDELGFLKKIYINNGFHYEISDGNDKHNHHHLICIKCGNIIEIKSYHNIDYLEDLENKISTEQNFEVKDHNLQFLGICSDCKCKDN